MNMHVTALPAPQEKRRMMMEPRISVITLGVEDVGQSVEFYTRLGFGEATQTSGYCAFFQLAGGLVLSLYRREHIFRDTKLEDAGPRFNGVSFAYTAGSELDVDKLAASFVAAGGLLIREPHKTFWGAYIAYAADPDGHAWEITYNPAFEMFETAAA